MYCTCWHYTVAWRHWKIRASCRNVRSRHVSASTRPESPSTGPESPSTGDVSASSGNVSPWWHVSASHVVEPNTCTNGRASSIIRLSLIAKCINCYDSNVFIITRCVGIASVATVIGNTTGQKRSHSSGQRVGHKSASCRLVFLFISFIVHYELWWTRVVCVLLDSQSTCCFAIWPVFTVGIGSSLDNQSRRNHRQLDIGSDYRWNKVNQSDSKGRENEHDNYSNESKRKGRRGGKELWLPPARMTWHLKRQGQTT